MDLKGSLNLPDPSSTIPMKANLPSLEPEILMAWDESGLYHLIQKARMGEPTFVLHDGPPYTNSPIHIGTALNKILKDFVVKSRTMMGFRAPYVPGFDNHGLPIEQAVMKAFNEKKQKPTVIELRRACREHARKYLEVQRDQFKRIGVVGLWEKPYSTMNYRFEAEILRVFKRLVEADFVYKGLRPTLWSPTSRTALADTEIVYRDHVSKVIYVRFPLKHDHNGFSKGVSNFYTIIWTTTPWTIPANLAVAFNPAEEYTVVKVGSDHYLIASALVEKVAEALGWTGYTKEWVDLGATFEGSTFAHPIFGRDSVAVLADYVTMEDGTGVVHTAPGHGRDDFYTGQKYNLPILTPVDERGVLTTEAGEFEGTFYKDCDTKVVDRLAELGHLLKAYDYSHSYPYAERDEQPVIFRATEQWFIGLDRDGLRQRMLAEIEDVQWIPESGLSRIKAMVTNRPDWCISRQRPWGVGIPVFYGVKTGVPVLDPEAIEAVAKLVEQEGSDAWFDLPASQILPPGYRNPDTGETEFRKETDVLDVWFDSGATSMCVLEGNVEPEWKEKWPADLYLEGSDQHRGWFNSSLILASAVKEQAPYKAVMTCGFVTDDQGRKMSKRLGNVIDPMDASGKHGADVLRYWTASVDYANDVPCSDALLKTFGDNYRSIRNTLRFLLGCLYDYSPSDAPAELLPIDEWAVEQTDLLCDDCIRMYEEYSFGGVISSIHNFCRGELSSFYLDVIKDRMYCDGADWPSRRSAQAACRRILVCLLKFVAPILPFTAEETWQTLQGTRDKIDCSHSIHLQTFERPSRERLSEIEGSDLQSSFAAVLAARRRINAAFEEVKKAGDVKDSQDVVASLPVEGDEAKLLRSFPPDELAVMLRLSWIDLVDGSGEPTFQPSPYPRCERSRLRRPDVTEVEGMLLTKRDQRALGLTAQS